MLRVIIADDHSVVRRGLKQILQDAFPSIVIEEVGDAENLVKKVLMEDWEVVVTDISMPGRSGLDVIQQIRQQKPVLPILVLSVHPEDQYALRVIKAGASGYLNKDSAPEELVNAINRLLMGKKYITPAIAEKMAESMSFETQKLPHELLSDREFEVLKLLAAGKSVSDIGEQILLSPSTVSTYRARIMIKMNLKTNAELTLYAIKHNLISES